MFFYSKNAQLLLISVLLLGHAFVPTQQGSIAGPGCFATCFSFCATMGPGKFAGFVGIVFDIQGCGAMCTALCANAAFIPGLCFGENTVFLDVSMNPVNVSALKAGDIVQTMVMQAPDIGAAHSWISVPTVVTTAMEMEAGGPFPALNIHLVNEAAGNSSKMLTVTENHGILLLLMDDNGQPMTKVVAANEAAVGHKMVGIEAEKFGNVWTVQLNEQFNMPVQYFIQTEADTALASGLLTTTSCMH